jgi:hypothetical protein
MLTAPDPKRGTMSIIVMRRYREDSSEEYGLVEAEMGQGEIDLIFCPRTSDAQTFSFSAEEAWRLVREIAKAAAEAECWEG